MKKETKHSKSPLFWIVTITLWLLFLCIPFILAHTHENKEIVDFLNVSFLAASALFTAFAFAATYLSLVQQKEVLNKQIDLNVFTDTIRVIMHSDRFLECRNYILSDCFYIDINKLKRLVGNNSVCFKDFRIIIKTCKDDIVKKELRDSYEKIIDFCGKMEYLGLIYKNKGAESLIVDYYGRTIVESYKILEDIIENSRKEDPLKRLYNNYTELYRCALETEKETKNKS